MFHIRTTKTSSGAIAIQVIKYKNRKRVVMAHMGSAHSKTEIVSLKQTALQWIEKNSKQQSLLPVRNENCSYLLPLNKCRYIGIRYSFIYETLSRLFVLFGFHLFHNSLLTDLILIRIVEPASKLRSLKLLEQYFGVKHERRDFYRKLKTLSNLKYNAEDKVLSIAKKHFNFDFSLVFYDVTTLYFESFKPDELRKCGFSKDNKSGQPQILIGLMVNADGFPVSYEIFAGNKFEGHTFIPFIMEFRRKHQIKQLTVVADAAMLSLKNMQELNNNSLNYIVGARLNNISEKLLKDIDNNLSRNDGAAMRFIVPSGDLICGFSKARFRKDKREMEKQIQKAETALREPSKIKRIKFLKNGKSNHFELNAELIEKQKILLGVKGYYTNLPPEIDNQDIIKYYCNLWHVEQTFRVAKYDLQMRPMYHFKK